MLTRTQKMLSCAGLTLALTAGAHCAELSWPDTAYSHYSNQESLRDVPEVLGSSHALPIVVSESIDDVISVSFNKLTPAEMFERLARAYNLTWYYDGNTLFVYRIDEVQTATLKLSHLSVLDFQKSLQDLEIYDTRYPWRVVERQNIVYFSGPPRLVSLIDEMARQLDVAGPGNSGGRVYTWRDARGVAHFSSTPPEQTSPGSVRVIKLQEGTLSGMPEPATAAFVSE